VLLMTMLVDVTISLLSFRPGMTAFVLLGLDWDKISVVALAVYLAWNRRAVKEAGLREFNPARQTRRLTGSGVERDN
jgi:quinol-cytochrome oxidoreductase complex cytochrome b subunit